MNALIQSALAFALSGSLVTAAVTMGPGGEGARAPAPIIQAQVPKVPRWLAGIVLQGVDEDDDPYFFNGYNWLTEKECRDAIQPPPQGDPDLHDVIFRFLLAQAWVHKDDVTFDFDEPSCWQREMDPPGRPI